MRESNYIQHLQRQEEREKDRQTAVWGGKPEKKINDNTTEVELSSTVQLLSLLCSFFHELTKIHKSLFISHVPTTLTWNTFSSCVHLSVPFLNTPRKNMQYVQCQSVDDEFRSLTAWGEKAAPKFAAAADCRVKTFTGSTRGGQLEINSSYFLSSLC